MDQPQTFCDGGRFEKHAKRTRRAEFLSQMNMAFPWRELVAEIEPFIPGSARGVRRWGWSGCLRMYFLQQWFNLSDAAMEEALYESLSMRAFAGIDLGREPVPDETTVCKFCHPLKRHSLGAKDFSR